MRQQQHRATAQKKEVLLTEGWHPQCGSSCIASLVLSVMPSLVKGILSQTPVLCRRLSLLFFISSSFFLLTGEEHELPEDVLYGVVGIPVDAASRLGEQDVFAGIGASAVVLDKHGTLLTLEEALHEREAPYKVSLPGGGEARARVLQRCAQSTAVLLALEDPEQATHLRPIPLAPPSRASIGDWVWTLGNAFNALELDASPALSKGIVSAIYTLPDGPPLRGRAGAILSTYHGPVYEITAAVNDGNQGGPLVDGHGRLLGLVSMGLAQERKLGTAIPIRHLLAELTLPHPLPDSDPSLIAARCKLVDAAQAVAPSLTLVYFHRPQGPGNPPDIRRPATITPSTPAHRRLRLQQAWERYYHIRQVLYTDQAVSAVVLDASEGLLLTALSNLHGGALSGHIVDKRLEHPNPVQVIGVDRAMDLALLQAKDALPMPDAVLRTENNLALGEGIAVLGRHHAGGDFTVTTGIVSALQRMPPGSRVPFIQIDALTNYGSLGGVLINRQGEIQGIVTLLGPQAPWLINSGVSMVSDVHSIARALPAMRHLGGDLGRPRPGLGVLLDDAMRIVRLVPDSGADQAGLRLGDRILRMDGAEIEDIYDLRTVLAGRVVGDPIAIDYERADQQKQVTVILGRLD